MAAGQGFKTFTTGEVLTAGDVNGYLMQGVLVFASAAARDAAITSPQEGQFAFTKDTNGLWYYDGATWVASGATGDIEGVTAGVGISGGGTSGTVTITNSMATAIDAKGDLVAGTGADTFAKLTVGANDTVLTADSTTATGLKWATSAAPSSGATLISRTAFSASSGVTVDSIFSNTYENYLVAIQAYHSAGNNALSLRGRVSGSTQTGSIYNYGFTGRTAGSASTIGFNASNSDRMPLGTLSSIGSNNEANLQFYRASASDRLYVTGNLITAYDSEFLSGGAFFAQASTWDGLYLYPASGTITGQITVYGLAKS
jgi:hypothetical protein